jgi:asparagine synthase (glutamine-hydrolysing)
MCGIAAIYSKSSGFNFSELASRKKLLFNMMNCMRHRGPDSDGVYLSHRAALGMVRLNIVGGEFGNQPIWNEDHTIAVVCNGEIYNHLSLRTLLQESGHTLSTQSDVEVIVHLYEQFQLGCLQHLEGIFAFVLWDCKRERMFVARDRVGVKPLYVAQTAKSIAFASEMRALLSLPETDIQFDDTAFTAYNCLRFVPGNDTIVNGIRKLRPAEYMIIEENEVVTGSYWNIQMNPLDKPLTPQVRKERSKELRAVLLDAVASQYTSEVKSGVLLSGGMDSTALLAIQRNFITDDPHAITVSFAKPHDATPESEYNEIEQAAKVAGVYGANHIFERVSAKEVLERLPSIVAALDEPIADPTAIPLWFAARLARQAGLKVVYSGEGLDELFNGYDVYKQVYWLKWANFIPKSIRKFVLAVLLKTGLPGRGVLTRSLSAPSNWYKGIGQVCSLPELKGLLREEYLVCHKVADPKRYVEQILDQASDQSVLCQMTYFDLMAWLPENTLVKSDKISMAHSIELRVPFLHRPVVEIAAQMSDKEKLYHNRGKWVVRQALSGLVPHSILHAKKTGFPVPLTAWMFHEWMDFAKAQLLDSDSVIREFYRPQQIEQLFLVPQEGRRRAARILWAFLCFELWYRNVYKPASLAGERQLGNRRDSAAVNWSFVVDC